MISLAYAESTGAAPAAPSPLVSLAPLLFIFVVFYFLLIRPQQKKMKEHKKMIESLKVGSLVVTSSGIYGTIVSLGDTTLEVKIADNVKIKILRSSVNEVVGTSELKISEPQVVAK